MGYEYHTRIEGNTLVLEATGDRTDPNWKREISDLWKFMGRKCRDAGISRILILTRAHGKPENFDTFNFFKDFLQVGIGRQWSIAVVDEKPEEEAQSFYRLAEATLYNSGFKRVKIFDSESEARKWLG